MYQLSERQEMPEAIDVLEVKKCDSSDIHDSHITQMGLPQQPKYNSCAGHCEIPNLFH